MSAGYVAVGWSPGKRRYDAIVFGAAALFLATFVGVGLWLRPEITAETLLIRAFGTLALALLHVVLAIGPLARLDRRYLPLLWNRRHLGVTMFVFALAHGGFALFQFHALGDRNPLVSLLTSNTHWTSVAQFPFQQLGAAALNGRAVDGELAGAGAVGIVETCRAGEIQIGRELCWERVC